MRPKKLSEEKIDELISKLPSWKRTDAAISKTYTFEDFVKSLEFVNLLGAAAEKVQHHPDVDIRYNKVTILLTTHDAGGLTDFDFNLAQDADKFADLVKSSSRS